MVRGVDDPTKERLPMRWDVPLLLPIEKAEDGQRQAHRLRCHHQRLIWALDAHDLDPVSQETSDCVLQYLQRDG